MKTWSDIFRHLYEGQMHRQCLMWPRKDPINWKHLLPLSWKFTSMYRNYVSQSVYWLSSTHIGRFVHKSKIFWQMRFGMNIHGSQRMILTDFGDPLTFPRDSPFPWSKHHIIKSITSIFIIWSRRLCSLNVFGDLLNLFFHDRAEVVFKIYWAPLEGEPFFFSFNFSSVLPPRTKKSTLHSLKK